MTYPHLKVMNKKAYVLKEDYDLLKADRDSEERWANQYKRKLEEMEVRFKEIMSEEALKFESMYRSYVARYEAAREVAADLLREERGISEFDVQNPNWHFQHIDKEIEARLQQTGEK
jgi:hypothetical protein